MKNSLLLSTTFILTSFLPATADVAHKECLNSKDYEGCMNHQKCLKVSDYEGCMRFNSTPTSNSSNSSEGIDKEVCYQNGFCIAGDGRDILGMPKIKGWQYKEFPERMAVAYTNDFKVKVRGSYGRYVESVVVYRNYQSPKAGTTGTAPSSFTYGQRRTNCTGYDTTYNTTINCRTTPATTINLPGIAGRPATPGGMTQWTSNHIFDCKEKTLGIHLDSRLSGKWKPIPPKLSVKAKYLCSVINTLPESSFMKYAEQ